MLRPLAGASLTVAWGQVGEAMLGVSRTITRERMAAFEFLRIETRADGIYYVAQPGGRPPTAFKLTQSTASQAVFENSRHDHPKIIPTGWKASSEIYFSESLLGRGAGCPAPALSPSA